MEREELLRATAKRYAAAQIALEEADRAASAANTRAVNARLERDRIEKELREFVGRNQPLKAVSTGDGRMVLIRQEWGGDERVFVSLESLV